MTIWDGAWYFRKRTNSWRNRNTGLITGRPYKKEVTNYHYYSKDYGSTARPVGKKELTKNRLERMKKLPFRPKR